MSTRTTTSSWVLNVPSSAVGGSTPKRDMANGTRPVTRNRPFSRALPVADMFIDLDLPAMDNVPEALIAKRPSLTFPTRASDSEKEIGALPSASRSFPFIVELSQSIPDTGMVTVTSVIAANRPNAGSADKPPEISSASQDQSWIVEPPSTHMRLPLAKE